jgi:hypothetical protein
MMRLYLASRSPRRRELLHQMGINFDTLVFAMVEGPILKSTKRRVPVSIRWFTSNASPGPNRSTVKRSSMNASCHNARFFPPIPRWNLPGRLSASRLMRPMQPPFCSDYPGKRIVF